MEALYSEIERLSGAWQLLDEQNSAKVWIMASTEEKLQRLSVEVRFSDSGLSQFIESLLIMSCIVVLSTTCRKRKPTIDTLACAVSKRTSRPRMPFCTNWLRNSAQPKKRRTSCTGR